MTAPELLADLLVRGFDLRPLGGGLRIHPASRLTDDDRRAVQRRQAELLRLLVCPSCRRPLDHKGRCWRCCNRRCRCGRQTGSAFIATCLLCEAEQKKKEA
jgi:hypothetical protein